MRLPALYIRQPHADMVLSGAKTVETRGYEPIWMHRTVAVLQPGVKGPAQVIGWIRITGSKMYLTHAEWAADYHRHLIPDGHELYGWGTTQVKYGWDVEPADAPPGTWTVRRGGRVWTTVETEDSELMARG